MVEPVGADRVERRPRVNPRLGWPWGVVAGLLCLGLGFAATDHMLRATVAVATALVTGAVLRAVLGDVPAGGLRVRGRLLDVAVLLVLAGAVLVSGLTLDLTVHR